MHIFFLQFWWLVFPVMWFVTSLVRMLIQQRRHRDAMEVARAYAANGREPPAEIRRILTEQVA